MIRHAACCAVVIGCLGCAANDGIPDTLVPVYEAPPPAELEGCLWIVDLRSREDFHGYTMPSEGALAWLKAGVEARLGVAAVVRMERPENDVYLGLDRAYMSHIATSISGVVVLEVGDRETTQAFRGRVTRSNWWGTDSEYSSLMNDALDDALLEVAPNTTRSGDCQ